MSNTVWVLVKFYDYEGYDAPLASFATKPGYHDLIAFTKTRIAKNAGFDADAADEVNKGANERDYWSLFELPLI